MMEMSKNRKQYSQEWELKHRKERLLYKKNYRESHKTQIKEARKKYYLEHKEKEMKSAKIYQEKHKEELKQYRINNKEKTSKYKLKYDKEHQKENYLYRINRKEVRNETLRKYMKNPINRIARNLRIRLWSLLKNKNKSKSTMKLVGCSLEFLKQHLEKQFKKGMDWNNYGKYGWHVDHIRQCAGFDLSEAKQIQSCFHYTNLRPLWAKENLSRPRIKKLICFGNNENLQN